MRQKLILKPFGVDGDLSTIEELTQVDGSISWQQGWGADYQRQGGGVDPLYKPIDRATTNFLFKVITEQLQQYQSFGFPEFITASDNGGSAFSYDAGAIVRWSATGAPPFGTYISMIDANTSVPGADTNWRLFVTGGQVNLVSYSTTGNFIVPAGIYSLDVEGWGGGGGGAGSGSGGGTAGGGGAGGYFRKIVSVVPGQVLPYVIGTGGNGGGVGGAGTDGGATSFNGVLFGNGGSHGAVNPAGNGGAGGTASGGTINITGSSGSSGSALNGVGGQGGSSPMGGGGGGGAAGIAGPGGIPGGGGGGGGVGSAGGPGARGQINIKY